MGVWRWKDPTPDFPRELTQSKARTPTSPLTCSIHLGEPPTGRGEPVRAGRRAKRKRGEVGGRRERNERPGSWLATPARHCPEAVFISRQPERKLRLRTPGQCHRARGLLCGRGTLRPSLFREASCWDKLGPEPEPAVERPSSPSHSDAEGVWSVLGHLLFRAAGTLKPKHWLFICSTWRSKSAGHDVY